MAFLPLQDEEAPPLLEHVPEEERFASWHLVERDGSLASRGTGGIAVFGHLRATRSLGHALRALRAERALDRLYDAVARNRRTLGRLVPDRPGPRRFP